MDDMIINLPICPDCFGSLRYTDTAFDKFDGTVVWDENRECCPECGKEMQQYDEDIVWFNCQGYCLRCGKEYHWREKYSFSGVASMKCVGEREV